MCGGWRPHEGSSGTRAPNVSRKTIFSEHVVGKNGPILCGFNCVQKGPNSGVISISVPSWVKGVSGLKKRVIVVRQPAECWLCIQDGQDAVAGSVEKVWEHDRRPIAEVRMLWPVPESDKFRGKSTRLTIVS